MLFLGSLIFNILLYSSLPVICALILILYPLCSPKRLSKIASIWISFILFSLKLFCGINWEIEGASNIPKTPVIIVANHQGQWESLFLQTIIHPIATIIKKELLYIPFFGWALAFMGPIPINRKNKIQSLRRVQTEAIKRIDSGFSVLIFPEGTRVKPKKGIGDFSNSCGYISTKYGVPILPICHDSGKYWVNKEFIKRPGTVKIKIGPLFAGGSSKELTQRVRSWINDEYLNMG